MGAGKPRRGCRAVGASEKLEAALRKPRAPEGCPGSVWRQLGQGSPTPLGSRRPFWKLFRRSSVRIASERIYAVRRSLSVPLFIDDPLSPLQTSPCDLNQPRVPVSPGSQLLGEEHARAQPQPGVHKLPTGVPAELPGRRGLRDTTARESGSPVSEQEEQ